MREERACHSNRYDRHSEETTRDETVIPLGKFEVGCDCP